MKAVGGLALLCCGCSLVFDLSEYDGGGGSGGGGTASTNSTSVSSGTGTGTGTGTGASTSSGIGNCEVMSEVQPVANIQETFDAGAGMLAPNGTCGSIGGGVALFDPTYMLDGDGNVIDDFCWLRLPEPVRLTCSSLTLRLIDATDAVFGTQTYVYLDDLSSGQGAHLLLEIGGYSLSHVSGSPDVPFTNANYDAIADRYWRLSGDDRGNIAFETSTDGVSFVMRAYGASPIPLDNLRIRFGAGTHQDATADGGDARFDCLNVVPCP